MYRRILTCLVAIVFVAMGQQSLTVQKLIDFIHSQDKLIKEKKGTDQELAKALASIRLSEKLELSVIEDLQGDGAGPLTVKVLQKLQEQTRGLKEAVIQQTLPDIPRPAPSLQEQGRIIEAIREYVSNYDNNLPDFICLEVEQRMVAPGRGGRSGPSYQLQDTITSKITYFHHEEKKEPILNGSKVVTGDYESLGGATSRGDFETALKMLFDPRTEARFEWGHWATLRKRPTMVFTYEVSADRSQYRIGVEKGKVERITAYKGEVYVDEEPPHAVTKLRTKAIDIPPDFPIQRADTELDYQFADVGGQQFLLPYNEEIQLDGPDTLSKNSNTFQYYRKYEVGSSISFDLPKDFKPAPPDTLKESTPVKPGTLDCKDPKNKDAPGCKGKQ